MDLKFNQKVLKYLQSAVREYQTQEQTQEIRIPEGMPDIAMVLACWGEPVIRGKEWRSDQVGVTVGVMAKILYLPEDVGPPQILEAWLPFQMKCSIPTGQPDGALQVIPVLRSADARVLSARKIMVRTNVGMQMEALTPAEFSVYQPDEIPEDVQLLTNRYYLNLPVEAGEKAFGVDEILELPASETKIEQPVRLSLSPQVLEQKVLADKLIFRGLCVAHLLYRSGDGQLHSRDFDVPFSQYADLDGEFAPEATVQVLPILTNLELEQTPEGAVHLKAGLSGQYMIYDRVAVDMVQDAYSPVRTVDTEMEKLSVPAVLEQTSQSMNAQADPQVDVMRPVDVSFWREYPYVVKDGDNGEADLGGTFQMLYYDPEGQLQTAQTRWEDTLRFPAGEDAAICVNLLSGGKAQYSAGMLRADLLTEISVTSGQGMDMVTGLKLGEITQPSPDRPSLIIIRTDGDSLWQIAKENGATVDSIRAANALADEPAADSVLLIPVF